MSITHSSTTISRHAFGDSTNISRKRPSLFEFPSRARKSPPTCTLSFASVNASCINTAALSSSPSAVDPSVNLTDISIVPFPSSCVPFPSTTTEPLSSASPSSTSVSKSDPCTSTSPNGTHALLRITSNVHVRPRVRASPVEVRRRRSTPRPASPCAPSGPAPSPSPLPLPPTPTTENSYAPLPYNQRKRTRKSSRRIPAELRFLATVQRSIAWLLECKAYALGMLDDTNVDIDDRSISEVELEMNMQDKYLACRLRTFLIGKGVGPEVLDLDPDAVMECSPPPMTAVAPTADAAAAPAEQGSDPDVIMMNVDSEGEPPSSPAPVLLLPSARSPSTACAPLRRSDSAHDRPTTIVQHILSPPQIVAALILRHRCRPRARSIPISTLVSASSPDGPAPLDKELLPKRSNVRWSSPLARSEPISYASFHSPPSFVSLSDSSDEEL